MRNADTVARRSWESRVAEETARYWSAKTPSEETAAYRQMLLLGCRDGYAVGRWRPAIARILMRMAYWVEG